ncbi:hypothetical protein F2Q69_00023797 [Brassica cretica]|uniref:DUF1985 domain-containing protein n=1 Tax=Brassica cretica TaxID=69181 RepID=A0A8S9Q9V8_BRACR|nr:hypothetical protein F2Q69_00023797 [Brassica cretica]
MAIQSNVLKFSGKLVHSFLCKERITSNMHEKWFFFARTPLRFSLQEFHAVTGLKISRESSSDIVKWKDDGGVFGVRKFHLGLHYDFWLSLIEKTRKKLDKKESYIFKGLRCDNWKGAAKVSYEDIIQIEDSFPENGELFSIISLTGSGDVFLDVDYTRKETEMEEAEKEDIESEDEIVDDTDVVADVETSLVNVAGK